MVGSCGEQVFTSLSTPSETDLRSVGFCSSLSWCHLVSGKEWSEELEVESNLISSEVTECGGGFDFTPSPGPLSSSAFTPDLTWLAGWISISWLSRKATRWFSHPPHGRAFQGSLSWRVHQLNILTTSNEKSFWLWVGHNLPILP